MSADRARRVAAALALIFAAAAVLLALAVAIQRFPAGLSVLACLAAAAVATWWAFLHRGAARAAAAALALALLASAIALTAVERRPLADVVIFVCVGLSLAAARHAFAVRASLPAAPRPSRPVLFYNPKSGGGKAERFNLAAEARERGIEPRMLDAGDDLALLVEDAIRGGADALAMAGGDGSQAVVAAAAAAHELPYACIPAGTRNHFALDLGVDRNDVVGALDAFVDGRERLVDLAAVNGRTFVNNVSLGFYAEAVARKGYRHAKIRTMLDTAPDALGSKGSSGSNGLRWEGPDGRPRSHAAVLMVSNDSYRLGGAVGVATRPRLDAGVLGIAAITHVGGRARLEEWSAAGFEIRSDEQIPAGIDGESVKLDPPLVFESRPGVLRARIAAGHAGASPSAGIPENAMGALRRLVELAFGRGSNRT